MPESDLDLARRMLRGDESAFERFFDAAYRALYRFALARIDGDRDAAAEIAQATICKAIRKLHTYRGEAALLTWLSTFCRRELYAYATWNRTRLEVTLVDDAMLRVRVDRTVLHGSIDGLTPAEALAAVLPASGLTFRVDGDRLLLSALPSTAR